MPRLQEALEFINLRPPPPPRELLVAIFAAALEAGLTTTAALRATMLAARTIDPAAADTLELAALRADASVDREQTFRRMAVGDFPPILTRLFAVIGASEATGENMAERARLLFDDLLAEREVRITRKAETYPIAMIILMVLLFMPAVLMLLVGPSYLLLLRVLKGA